MKTKAGVGVALPMWGPKDSLAFVNLGDDMMMSGKKKNSHNVVLFYV